MTIREMPAGPEVDASVAEKVMGWEWAVAECEHPTLNDGRCRKPDGCITYFRPSRDMSAAWLVAVKAGIGVMPFNDRYLAGPTQKGCRDTRPVMMVWAEADTAPLAICRAALLAALEFPK